MCTTWEDVFSMAKDEIDYIHSRITHEDNITPRLEDLYRAFSLTPLDKVRVILLGQDPYPGRFGDLPKATGLSFSIRENDPIIPPSLRNIFKELKFEYPGIKLDHGCLESWAKQGVLCLNMSLSGDIYVRGKHIGLWNGFLHYVFKALGGKKVVWILLGREARNFIEKIGSNNSYITAGHPSSMNVRGGFLKSNIFKSVNERLDSPINWEIVKSTS